MVNLRQEAGKKVKNQHVNHNPQGVAPVVEA